MHSFWSQFLESVSGDNMIMFVCDHCIVFKIVVSDENYVCISMAYFFFMLLKLFVVF